jgi:hypothetical protein
MRRMSERNLCAGFERLAEVIAALFRGDIAEKSLDFKVAEI